jgi:zinc protease
MSSRGGLVLATLLGSLPTLAACATAPEAKPEASQERATPDAPFRAGPPPTESRHYVPPAIELTTLPNGLRLLLVERHGVHVATAELVARGGSGAFPQEDPLAFSIMVESARIARGNQSERELVSAMSAKLFEVKAWANPGWTTVLVQGASSTFPDALRALRDVVLMPAFPSGNVEAHRQRHVATEQRNLHDPSMIGERTLEACLYGDAHPYTRFARAALGGAGGLSRDDVVRVWKEAFDPAETMLVVVGDVDPRAVGAQVVELFGEWKHDPTRPAARPIPPPQRSAPRLVVVDRAHAPQARVVLGAVISPPSSPEHVTDLILSLVAGRMRSSATNELMRAEPAAIWGGRVQIWARGAGSTLEWEGNVESSRVPTALAALGDQWRALREQGPAPAELEAAKQLFIRALPRSLETVGGLRDAVTTIAASGWPLDDLANRRANAEAVTAERVRAETPPLTAFTAVVVGDLATLEGPLLALGWGPLEVRDESGKYLRTITPPGAR